MPKHTTKIKDIEDKFDEVEQYADQLHQSNNLSYDHKFHMEFTRKYAAFIRFLIECNADNDLKILYLKRIQGLYEQR